MCIWITLGRWEDARYIENKFFYVTLFVKMFQTYYILLTWLEQRNIETGYEAYQFPPGQCCFGGRCHLCFAIHYLCNLEHTAIFSLTWHIASNWRLQLHSDCSSSTVHNRGFYASMGTKRRKFLTEIDFV